jgi:hypothetical protein
MKTLGDETCGHKDKPRHFMYSFDVPRYEESIETRTRILFPNFVHSSERGIKC